MKPGRYDREVFLMPKESSRRSVAAATSMDFLAPARGSRRLEEPASPHAASLATECHMALRSVQSVLNQRHNCWVTAIRSCEGGRTYSVHIVNGQRDWIRSLPCPDITLSDCIGWQSCSDARSRAVLWLGTAERISAVVEMNHPGVWVMGTC